MSTATPTSPSPSRRYVDYDEFIDFQVQKTRAGIKSNDLLTALIGAAVFVLAYVLVFAAFDHWIIEGGFGRGTRIGLLAALLTGLSGWFVWKLAVPYFRRVTALYAAREIEETEPEFHGTLLTLIDLKEAGRPLSPSLRAALEKRAGLSLTHMNVEQAVDRRLLMRLSYVLLGLVVITCLYTVFSPKKLSNSLWRSLLPTSSVAVDTRTRIAQVQPGDVEVLARSQLEITAELSGELPDEVLLLYSTQDRRLVDERIVMRETEDGLRGFRGVITGENARGILQNLTYRITAGDAHSETFTVTVTQPPSATVDEVQYEFPAYMGMRGRTQVGGAIDAWEGAWVTILATANMPVESALVMFSDSDDLTQRAEELPVAIAEGTQLTARWQLRIRPDGTYPHFYRIQCRNDAGKSDPSPALYPVKIRPDHPPQIQLVQPQSDIERPANAVVPLLYAAQDPDFLLRSVILRLERNGESLRRLPRLFEGPPDRKSLTDSYDFDLSLLDLQAGDRLTYWLEARDNMEPFADRAGNRSNTPKLNISITEPASPEELQQQLEEDRREIDERLEKATQQPGEGGNDPSSAGVDDPSDAPSPPSADPPAASEEPPAESESQDESSQGGQPNGESQPQSGGESSPSTGRQQEGQPSVADSQQQQGEQPSESGEEEAPFDDLLKRLMQREQQQAEQRGDSDPAADQEPDDRRQEHEPSEGNQRSPSAGEAQASGDENQRSDPQQGGAGEQPSPAGDDAATAADRPPGDGTGPSSTPGGEPSAADPTQPARPSGANSDQRKPGDGTEPSPTAENPTVRQEGADGGQSSRDDTPSTPSSENTTDGTDPANGTPDKPGGTPSGDPMTSRAPDHPSADPTSSKGPDPARSPETLPRPNADGQPGTARQPTPDSKDPAGQPSDGRQRGENGGPQQQSEGQPASGQPGSGETASQPGQQSPAGQEGGQPSPPSGDSSPQPSQGSETSPSDSGQPGGQPQSSGNAGGQKPPQDGQPPAGGEADAPNDGGDPSADPQEGAGDAPASDQKTAGDQQPQDGQPSSGGQQPPPGQGQPQGEPGQGTQPGQPGGASQPGQPAGPGGQQQSPGTANEGGGSNLGADSDSPGRPVPGGGADGDQQPGNGAGEGEHAPADDIQGDDPDLENKKKAAELVLKRLEEQLQRGEIDPELQQELGVTDEQMRDFTDRLRQRLADTGEDQSPEAQARRRQFEESLRSFDFDSTGTERAGGDGPREASGGFTGPQRTAPLNRRDATRAYREMLSRKRQSSN